MSEITPETPVAATPPTVELVAGLMTEADNDLHDGYGWKLHMGASGNVVAVGVEPFADDGTLLSEVHFRAVVVEGETAPIVLERPEQLGGLSWDEQGGELLMPTADGIRMYPPATDWFDITPDDARELAAHLAAMADAHEAAQAQTGGAA